MLQKVSYINGFNLVHFYTSTTSFRSGFTPFFSVSRLWTENLDIIVLCSYFT